MGLNDSFDHSNFVSKCFLDIFSEQELKIFHNFFFKFNFTIWCSITNIALKSRIKTLPYVVVSQHTTEDFKNPAYIGQKNRLLFSRHGCQRDLKALKKQ